MTLPSESRSAFASTTDGDTDAGIDANMAVSGFSMTTVPPACFTSQAPADPSDPVPVRTTATTRSPWVLAALVNRRSIDGAIAPRRAGRSRSPSSVTSTRRFAGTTKMTPSSSGVVPSMTLIGRAVCRSRISARWLGRRGSRCWAMTTAAGRSAGRSATTRDRASIPPADEPRTSEVRSPADVAVGRLVGPLPGHHPSIIGARQAAEIPLRRPRACRPRTAR